MRNILVAGVGAFAIAGVVVYGAVVMDRHRTIKEISTDIPDSIRLCGTFESPGKVPGSITAEDFQMVITKDGAMIDPGPEDRIKLRICEEGE